MKFVATDKATNATYPSTSYKIQKVDVYNSFITSSTKGDNLPLTNFQLESEPCLDSRDTSKATNQ